MSKRWVSTTEPAVTSGASADGLGWESREDRAQVRIAFRTRVDM